MCVLWQDFMESSKRRYFNDMHTNHKLFSFSIYIAYTYIRVHIAPGSSSNKILLIIALYHNRCKQVCSLDGAPKWGLFLSLSALYTIFAYIQSFFLNRRLHTAPVRTLAAVPFCFKRCVEFAISKNGKWGHIIVSP